jgi:hypothetical protein
MMLPSTAASRHIPRGLGDITEFANTWTASYLGTLAANRAKGLAAYPGDSYYDPNRPGWLPYWIDTPTESEAKYAWLASGGDVTAQQVVNPYGVYTQPSAPPVVGAPTGSVLTVPPESGEQAQAVIDELIAQQMRDWQAQNAAEMAALNKKVNPMNTFWPIVVVAGIGAVLLLQRKG